ncbi:MAG: prolipoprotein diacylglyceryl transferase [Bacteroidia bacterium]|nr:prolipoprotein diacylglyceryl transferase [Bacteroidia bacterium]
MTLNYIVWDVNPYIFVFPENFPLLGGHPVAWYGLLWAMVFIIGYYLIKAIFKKEGLGEEWADKILMYMLVFTIVGARLGHCLFYEPAYYFGNPVKFLAVWEGGLSSHGGAIGILIGMYIYSKKLGKPFLWVLDRLVICVAIGGALIRTGNLMNSEIYGDATTLPWGFKFVREWAPGTPIDAIPACHPTQIYEALFCIITFVILLRLFFKKDTVNKYPGFFFSFFLLMIFGSRIIIEFIKQPQVEFENSMTLDMGQWLSIPFFITGIVIMVMALKGKFKAKEIKVKKR